MVSAFELVRQVQQDAHAFYSLTLLSFTPGVRGHGKVRYDRRYSTRTEPVVWVKLFAVDTSYPGILLLARSVGNNSVCSGCSFPGTGDYLLTASQIRKVIRFAQHVKPQ